MAYPILIVGTLIYTSFAERMRSAASNHEPVDCLVYEDVRFDLSDSIRKRTPEFLDAPMLIVADLFHNDGELHGFLLSQQH